MNTEGIWLTWDNHRRTRELAKAMGMEVNVIDRGPWGFLDPGVPLLKTLITLCQLQTRVVITQNPSLLLTAVVAAFKPLKGYMFVQDLHSYFAQHMVRPTTLRG